MSIKSKLVRAMIRVALSEMAIADLELWKSKTLDVKEWETKRTMVEEKLYNKLAGLMDIDPVEDNLYQGRSL